MSRQVRHWQGASPGAGAVAGFVGALRGCARALVPRSQVSRLRRVADLLRRGARMGSGTANEGMFGEIRTRLINVEHKVNALRDERDFSGHPDQAYGHFSYAQHGEDMIVVNIFEILGIVSPSFLDVGAHHPINLSNTALLSRRGSRGINVEANPNLIEAFKKFRPNDINLNCGVGPRPGHLDFYYIDDWAGRNTFDKAHAHAFVRQHPQFSISKVEKIEVKTLDRIVAEVSEGRWPDFLSIDTEGWDYAVLQASRMCSGDGPKVVCVEVVTGGDADRSSDVATLLRGRGYRPYARTHGNVIFIDAETEQRLQC